MHRQGGQKGPKAVRQDRDSPVVRTPLDLLIDNFKVQWVGGTALDLQVVMSVKA
jgi:hypothetical protein